MQSPMALTPLSPDHSSELIDNLYLTRDHSNYSATARAFLIYVYIPDPSGDDIVDIITAQLDEMQKLGIQTSSDNLNTTMTVDPVTDTHMTTYANDETMTQETNMTSPYLEGVPHVHIVTLPTFSIAADGLTLLASKQVRWTSTLPPTCIPELFQDNLKKPLLNQTPTITRKNVDKPIPANDTCTIHNHDFQDQTVLSAYHLFRAATILMMHRYLAAVEHRNQNQTATGVEQLSPPTQALPHALDSVQTATNWILDTIANTMSFTPTEDKHNPVRLQV
jgi:hypothetical protein